MHIARERHGRREPRALPSSAQQRWRRASRSSRARPMRRRQGPRGLLRNQAAAPMPACASCPRRRCPWRSPEAAFLGGSRRRSPRPWGRTSIWGSIQGWIAASAAYVTQEAVRYRAEGERWSTTSSARRRRRRRRRSLRRGCLAVGVSHRRREALPPRPRRRPCRRRVPRCGAPTPRGRRPCLPRVCAQGRQAQKRPGGRLRGPTSGAAGPCRRSTSHTWPARPRASPHAGVGLAPAARRRLARARPRRPRESAAGRPGGAHRGVRDARCRRRRPEAHARGLEDGPAPR